jgi:hypothetical protein
MKVSSNPWHVENFFASNSYCHLRVMIISHPATTALCLQQKQHVIFPGTMDLHNCTLLCNLVIRNQQEVFRGKYTDIPVCHRTTLWRLVDHFHENGSVNGVDGHPC